MTSIAIHSYKGGTGKTTIASNLAAMLATKGYNVSLIDLDVYAPSLHTYFDRKPNKWINDFLLAKARVNEVMIDMTQAVEELAKKTNGKMGKLWLGLSSPEKEEIYKMEGAVGKQANPNMELLRNFIKLHEELIVDYNCDYVIIDTSPGVRYWSINSLAVADRLFLTLKYGDLDIEGTKKLATDIYAKFEEIGSKSYVLLNRVSGYCVPHTPASHSLELEATSQLGESDPVRSISDEVGINLISAIPCYCDIQFKRKEFLTAIQHPDHPFAKQLKKLADSDAFKA